MVVHFQSLHFAVTIFLLLFPKTMSDASPTCSVIQGLPGLNGRDGRDGINGLKGDPGKNIPTNIHSACIAAQTGVAFIDEVDIVVYHK